MTENKTPEKVRALMCKPCLEDGREHFRMFERYARRIETESGHSMHAVPVPTPTVLGTWS